MTQITCINGPREELCGVGHKDTAPNMSRRHTKGPQVHKLEKWMRKRVERAPEKLLRYHRQHKMSSIFHYNIAYKEHRLCMSSIPVSWEKNMGMDPLAPTDLSPARPSKTVPTTHISWTISHLSKCLLKASTAQSSSFNSVHTLDRDS